MQRPPLPPFTHETALAKVKAAENAWNSRDPAKVAQAYTSESIWRNRDEFFQGRDAIEDFLTRKWSLELHYHLMKELWAYTDNRISVRFEYEWQHAKTGQWYRTHGNGRQRSSRAALAHCRARRRPFAFPGAGSRGDAEHRETVGS